MVVIPDMHLEFFSREERKILINKFVEKLLRERFDLLIFNGDFYAGGKRNRGKVVGLLHRLERILKKKIIHFPGSHEDFSHSYRFKFYDDFILMIPGSQFVARHGQKPIFIDPIISEELISEYKIDLLVTHDPFPETVDYTIYFSNDFVLPAPGFIEGVIKKYREKPRFRKQVKEFEVEFEGEFEKLIEESVKILNEERKIMSKILRKEFEEIEINEEILKAVAFLSYIHGVEYLQKGPAIHMEFMYELKEIILEKEIPFVVSGHIHENHFLNERIVKERKTRFCNPGPGYLGNYCVVDLDKKKIKVKSII